MPKKNLVKEAFSKVKSDIFTLESQILTLTREIQSLKRTLTKTDTQTHSRFTNGKTSCIHKGHKS